MESTNHRHHIRARFSAASRTYASVSQLQERVARRVIDMIPEYTTPARILDAGCGPGRLLSHAANRWPGANITGIDIAPGMIQEAKHHFKGKSRITLIEADVAHYFTDEPYDLIISSSAMHWLRPFSDGLRHLAELCAPGGMLAVSIMLDGTLGELHAARRAVAPHKNTVARLPTLEDFERAARLIPAGRVRRIEQSTTEYDQASASEVLKSVHEMGVTGGDISRGTAPLTRGELRALCDWYDTNCKTANGVRVSYVVGYLLLECGVD